MSCTLFAALIGFASFVLGNVAGFFLAGAMLNARAADEHAERELERAKH